MKSTQLGTKLRRLLPALVAGTLMAAPSFAADFYLVASRLTKTMPGLVTPIAMWGFATADSTFTTVGTPTVPGPMLTVPVGDSSLNIYVRNDLTEPISVVIPALIAAGDPTWTDNSTGARANLTQRVRSFTHETAPGAIGHYSWTGVGPGTYLYESGTHPSVQVQMGLYGGVKKDSALGEAYPSVTYAKEVVLFYSEIDPPLHTAVDTGAYGAPPFTSTFNYVPEYFLVNGDPYPNGTTTFTGLNTNDRILVRFLNAGLKTHVPTALGSTMSVVAEDAGKYTYAKEQYSVLLAAGKTFDALFVPGAASKYAVFDRALDVTNAGAPDGGLVSYLEVSGAGGAPVASDDTYSVAEDTPLSVAVPGVLGNDTPSSGLSAVLATTTANGTLALAADGSLTYTANANFNGTDLFTYKAYDGATYSNVGTVRITVTPVNDPPVTVANSYSTTAGTQLSVAAPGVLANDTDVDGDALTAVVGTGPAHALSFTLNANGSFSYTGACTYSGPDSFTYAARDASVTGNIATVSISVAARVNKAPVAVDDTGTVKNYTTTQTSVTISVLANDSDPDAACSGLNVNSVTIVSQPKNGSLTVNAGGTVTFRPKRYYRGTDYITYKVADANGAFSNVATVRVNVTR